MTLSDKLQRLTALLPCLNLTPEQTREVLLRTASNHFALVRIERMADELTEKFAEQRRKASWLQ